MDDGIFAHISGEGEGNPDGMKIDLDGRVYCTGPQGVHVLSNEGRLLGIIQTQAKTRNFCFGGDYLNTIYLAMHEMICSLQMNVAGISPTLI